MCGFWPQIMMSFYYRIVKNNEVSTGGKNLLAMSSLSGIRDWTLNSRQWAQGWKAVWMMSAASCIYCSSYSELSVAVLPYSMGDTSALHCARRKVSPPLRTIWHTTASVWWKQHPEPCATWQWIPVTRSWLVRGKEKEEKLSSAGGCII